MGFKFNILQRRKRKNEVMHNRVKVIFILNTELKDQLLFKLFQQPGTVNMVALISCFFPLFSNPSEYLPAD